MIGQVITAASGYGVEVVTPLGPAFARCHAGAVELVIGIVQLVDPKGGFEAALVECLVVGDQGKSLDEGLYLLPHRRKYGCLLGICGAKAMYSAAPVVVVGRFGLDE